MRRTVRDGFLSFGALAAVVWLLGCSPAYVVRAAVEQSKILLARRPIFEVLQDPETTAEEREKLRLVLDARAFAIRLGLDPACSFTKYTKLDKDVLAWVLVASRRDSFALRTWWFPIVGTVPYKGYFELEDARTAATALEGEGFEAWVRSTEAFSTLGWFNDPVLSTTLANSPSRIVNTVVHESVHSTIWIKGNVPFNESLANFVGTEGSVEFFARAVELCEAGSPERCDSVKALYAMASAERDFQYELGALIDDLHDQLQHLYGDTTLTSEQKVSRRISIFEERMGPFRSKYPQLKILKSINNAEIIQLKLYLSDLVLFRRLFERDGRDWRKFLERMRKVGEDIEQEDGRDPFSIVKESLASGETDSGSELTKN